MADNSKAIGVLSFWSIHNQLTQATVLPQVRAIRNCANVKRVLLITLESVKNIGPVATEEFVHVPLFLSADKLQTFGKIKDNVVLPFKIANVLKAHDCTALVAHGSAAGVLAYKVWKRTGIPFYISSFEPHAAYMLESDVWSRYGLKYNFQKRWEQQQKKYATGLMPVSDKYKQVLLKEGIPAAGVITVPCVVALSQFSFSQSNRDKIRHTLGITKANITGIYVGKYGGLYYQQEAFAIYKQCFDRIPDFRLIILSPQPLAEIIKSLHQQQIDISKVYIASVPHQEVPYYLSAADFGFATIKSYPSARYCSPVKIGEYWANGLPVLLTEGVGDDSDIIRNEGGGALFHLQQEGSVERALQQILAIISNPEHRQEISELAAKYRSPERIREAYAYFFGQRSGGGQI